MFEGRSFSEACTALFVSAKSVAVSEVTVKIAEIEACPCWTTELIVCKSGVPARFSSSGVTISSRISVTDAPLKVTEIVTVG